MKISLYLSVILGITFFTLRFIGLFLDLAYNDLFLGLGLFFLIGLGLPLHLINRYRYRQKVRKIIEDFRRTGVEHRDSDRKKPSAEKDFHEYPSFRNKKQGLKWGGGSVHGASASRGAKRSFLKK